MASWFSSTDLDRVDHLESFHGSNRRTGELLDLSMAATGGEPDLSRCHKGARCPINASTY